MTNTLEKIIGNTVPYSEVTENDIVEMAEYWNSVNETITDAEVVRAIRELRNIKEKKEYEKSNY